MVIIAACICPAAAAYKHNETIWSSSGNQVVSESYWNRLAYDPVHTGGHYYFTINPSTFTYLVTPFASPTRIDGATPRVKNITFALNMPVGVNVTGVGIFSGQSLLYSRNVTWRGKNAYTEYKLVMDSYKIANRGLSTRLEITNSEGSSNLVYTYGAGAVMEWN
jgi:hypothetical protein